MAPLFGALASTGRALRAAAHHLALAAARPTAGCGPGETLKRGFQVLGPEGFRTFDQEDRLIMAMTSSAKPLISQIKDISGRMLAEQTAPGDALLGLVQARLKVSQALRELDRRYGEGGDKIKNLTADEVKEIDKDTSIYSIDAIAAPVKTGVAP